MIILREAIKLIAAFEGCKLKAYKDVADVWTIGYGHTAGVKRGDVITQKQADGWLGDEVEGFLREVESLVYGYPTNANQLVAMTSLAYNIGEGAFRRSTVLRKHRTENYCQAGDAFLLWDKATVKGKKVVVPGLTNRRTAERERYLKL